MQQNPNGFQALEGSSAIIAGDFRVQNASEIAVRQEKHLYPSNSAGKCVRTPRETVYPPNDFEAGNCKMKPICVLENGSLTGINLTNMSPQDKIVAGQLFDTFANSRAGLDDAAIAVQFKGAITKGSISIGSLEILSKYCHTRKTWTPCIDPASAISKWLTGGMELPRLLDKSGKRVKEYQALCRQIRASVSKNA